MTFSDLNLIEPILRAVEKEGYVRPTPIQLQAIPVILKKQDLLACAQTGTGKTAAFALPILQLLSDKQINVPRNAPKNQPGPEGPGERRSGRGLYPAPLSGGVPPRAEARGLPRLDERREVRVLVLTPTRELASQIGESFTNYGRGLKLHNTVIFGGVGQNPQVTAIRRGVDILVATPGRLLDLMKQRLIHLNHLEIFVLDEADRMLDMGFIHDVRRVIAALPKKRQTLFFSATMPPEISRLSQQILSQPARIEVTPVSSTAERISQVVYHVQNPFKTSLLIELLANSQVTRSLVFTRTKRDANRVAEALTQAGIPSAAIHGNKSQSARERALASIKAGQTRVLVATDIAARGIDIDGVTHVFNHDIPNVPESYVHRIGRTARAGREGVGISFCASDERKNLADIEKLIRKQLPVAKVPEGLKPEVRKRGKQGVRKFNRARFNPRGGAHPSSAGQANARQDRSRFA